MGEKRCGGPSLLSGERLSEAAARLAAALAPGIGFVRPDLGRSLAQRRRAHLDLEAWGRARPPGPALWLHGASAGELLGAAPTIDALRAGRSFALLVTHFSPSGRAALPWLAPNHAGYPPLDTAHATERALKAVAPDLLVFAKLDVWPSLSAAAARAGVPMALVNAVVREGSRRTRPLARRLFRAAYARLDLVGAATRADADRLVALGARPEVVRVTGDAAFDLALRRADRARAPGGAAERLERRLPPRPPGGARLVAGSTWRPDEAALLEALDALGGNRRFDWQVLIAPHAPHEAHVRRLVGICRARGEPVARWADRAAVADLPPHGVVVLDEVGVLAEAYTVGDVAYVGGALGGSGLHNVLEPAAAGIPVLHGPHHDRGDAVALEAAGGGLSLAASELAAGLRDLALASERQRRGGRARAFVEAQAGAAEETARALAALWDRERAPPAP